MNVYSPESWIPIIVLPEIILACGAMILLLVGAYMGGRTMLRAISYGALGMLALTAAVLLALPAERITAFGNAYVMDGFAWLMKLLVLAASGAAIVISLAWLEEEKAEQFEFPILILIATIGMFMMISANDLIAMYMGLELQSLPLYVLAAFQRDSVRSTESGLKYFVLGALSSGMLLYGCSLVYGFSGTTGFDNLTATLNAHGGSAGLTVGLVFILAGLSFKISAVPFHMWTPDVYEGAPTPVTAFFSSAPKIAAMALFMRVVMDGFFPYENNWQQIVILVSALSMILGAFAAIGQSNIKRLMAYSSIGHMGFALVGLAAGTQVGLQSVIVYLVIYMIMNIGTFCCILGMRHREGATEDINDLAGLGQRQPVMAFYLSVFMFSLAGIPPLAGFFAKFYVFLAAIGAGLYVLAVLGVLASVVGAFYYLRVIKIIWFDEPTEDFVSPMPREINFLIAAMGILTIVFVLYPAVILVPADTAAIALFVP
ncbi:MAG: NADH-quinone oxidoreductase subunit NuoN [Parvularculales bacterium]